MAFARISVDDNDIDPRYGGSGAEQQTAVPRLYLASANMAGKASPHVFDGEYTFDALLSFVRRHAALAMDTRNIGKVNSTVNRQRLESLAKHQRALEAAAGMDEGEGEEGRESAVGEEYGHTPMEDVAALVADLGTVVPQDLGHGAVSATTSHDEL